MEIKPATIAQLKRGKAGKMIAIDADVGGVAQAIEAMGKNLKLRYSELGEYYVVFHRNPDSGKETLLTTAQELDHRLVHRLELVTNGTYDYLAELEKLERQKDDEADYLLAQRSGIAAERLAHALRKDLRLYGDAARSRKSWGKGGIVGH